MSIRGKLQTWLDVPFCFRLFGAYCLAGRGGWDIWKWINMFDFVHLFEVLFREEERTFSTWLRLPSWFLCWTWCFVRDEFEHLWDWLNVPTVSIGWIYRCAGLLEGNYFQITFFQWFPPRPYCALILTFYLAFTLTVYVIVYLAFYLAYTLTIW